MAEYSPMMQHYLETKEKYKDCILFYRLGDFYEMFFDDAINVSRELELTLTGKDCGQEQRAPMCGIPYHAAENYISRLVSNGHKVAICEQLEDPKQAKGIVKREVVEIVSKGTLTNTESLDETNYNFIGFITDYNYVYALSRNGIRTHEDEMRALDRVEFKDIELIYAIMAKYVLGGMTKGMLWSEAVENGTFLKCLQKLKEVLNVWDAPLA